MFIAIGIFFVFLLLGMPVAFSIGLRLLVLYDS